MFSCSLLYNWFASTNHRSYQASNSRNSYKRTFLFHSRSCIRNHLSVTSFKLIKSVETSFLLRSQKELVAVNGYLDTEAEEKRLLETPGGIRDWATKFDLSQFWPLQVYCYVHLFRKLEIVKSELYRIELKFSV